MAVLVLGILGPLSALSCRGRGRVGRDLVSGLVFGLRRPRPARTARTAAFDGWTSDDREPVDERTTP